MNEYTVMNGNTYEISNIYRSQRFDIDRMDISSIADKKPKFIRGYRIIDHSTNGVLTIHGEHADEFCYSLAWLENDVNKQKIKFDNFLLFVLSNKICKYDDYIKVNKKEHKLIH